MTYRKSRNSIFSVTMRTTTLVVVLSAVFGCVGWAKAVTIDFEGFNLGGALFLDVSETLVFNNVDGSGVNVTIVGGADNRVYDLLQFGGDPSTTGQALIDWFWPGGSNPVGTAILFDRPIPSFSLRAGDFGSDDDSPLMITAFDAQDQTLAQDSVLWDASSSPPFATLSVSAPSIRKVIYNSGGNWPNSTFIDDLTFIPEPATVALLGLGSLVLIRRRQR